MLSSQQATGLNVLELNAGIKVCLLLSAVLKL